MKKQLKSFKDLNVWGLVKSLNSQFSILNSRNGFTTIELMIVIVVTVILSTVLLVYSRTGERQIIVFKEQARVIGAISRAKSLSLATYGQADVPCGYGVHFEIPGTFFIFKDIATAGDCKTSSHQYSDEAEIIKGEMFKLDPAVSFEKFKGGETLDIVFIPPDPTIFINPIPDNDQGKMEITIKTSDGNAVARVDVTTAGQISSR